MNTHITFKSLNDPWIQIPKRTQRLIVNDLAESVEYHGAPCNPLTSRGDGLEGWGVSIQYILYCVSFRTSQEDPHTVLSIEVRVPHEV